MIVLKSDQVASFDCDETLVMWYTPFFKDQDTIKIQTNNDLAYVYPHLKHIEELKNHKARGHKIIVWSRGGYEWATAIVEALQLTNYVDLVACKPLYFWDDLTPNEVFTRYYKNVSKS